MPHRHTFTHLGAYVVQPRPLKSQWLIMQENATRHLRAWRQLTDLICCVPVTCCRTFSSSFSMRPAQWIILENKIRHFQSESLNVITWRCHDTSIRVSVIACECVCKTGTERVSLHLCASLFRLSSCQTLPLFQIPIWKYPCPTSPNVWMSGLVISTFSPHHILHISGRPWQEWQRTCSAGISGSAIKLLRSDRNAP